MLKSLFCVNYYFYFLSKNPFRWRPQWRRRGVEKNAISLFVNASGKIIMVLPSALIERFGVSCMLGEGLSGHCLIWASGILPPKLGDILGCLAFTKYFFVKNKTLPRSNYFLKIQLKINFLTFLNTDRNAPKKYQFSTSGSGQTENTHICVYVYFQFDHFPKLKIDF